MTLKEGTIVEGTVMNITNFGAFVDIQGSTGLVHISEVSDTFVKNIKDHLKEKDKVKVKVISVDNKGKISLSIKQANEAKKTQRPIEFEWSEERNKKASNNNFEDIMSKFLKDSEERNQDVKRHLESKGRSFSKR